MLVHNLVAHRCVAACICGDLLQPVPLMIQAVLSADDRSCLPQRCQVDQHWNAKLHPERALHGLRHSDGCRCQRAALQCGPVPHHIRGAGRQHQPAADPDLPAYLPDRCYRRPDPARALHHRPHPHQHWAQRCAAPALQLRPLCYTSLRVLPIHKWPGCGMLGLLRLFCPLWLLCLLCQASCIELSPSPAL